MNLLNALTFGPPLLILFYIFKSDKFPEPWQCILWTFLAGCFICIPAGYLNDSFIPTNEYSYIAGLTEESLKFLAFLLLVSTKIQFNERMDAIVYGVAISIGFATYENYFYVYFKPVHVQNPEISCFISTRRALHVRFNCSEH